MSDLISKNRSLVEWKEDFKSFVECLDIPRDDYEGIMAYIDEVPYAEPERKKGKWRRRLVDCGFNADWHCSECGWKTSLEEHGYNFCPNCGADMRGESDG